MTNAFEEAPLEEDCTVDNGLAPLFWLIVIGSSFWVLRDASRLGVKRGSLKSSLDLGPQGWFVCCLLLWIVAFPMYLIVRPKYVALRAAQDDPAIAAVLHTPGSGTVPKTVYADIPSQIAALSDLHSSGALSDVEFHAKKTELLGRM